jgi:hypothetical protein
LRANILATALASNDFNCNALAKDKEEQDDENNSPQDKVKGHMKAYYHHQTVKSKLCKLCKLGKLGEMAEALEGKFVNGCNSAKEGLLMHIKSLLHTSRDHPFEEILAPRNDRPTSKTRMRETSVNIPPRLQNETPSCNVKKKDNHEDPLEKEIQYRHLMPYLLERKSVLRLWQI